MEQFNEGLETNSMVGNIYW